MKALLFFFLTLPLVHAVSLEKLQCGKAAQEQTLEWQVQENWIKTKLGPKDAYYSSPAGAVGEWVMVKAIPQGIGLSKITPDGRIEVSFSGDKCRKNIKNFAQPKPLPDHISDKELQEFVSTHKKGLIYLWSANEPASQKGIPEIKNAATKLKLPLMILLDKDVTKGQLQKLKQDLGEVVTKRVDSIEFKMRSIETFPTLLIFKNGKLLSKMIEGQKEEDEFKKEVSQFLK